MEGVLFATEKQSIVSSFLEIAFGQSADTAKQYLQVMIFVFIFISYHFLLNSFWLIKIILNFVKSYHTLVITHSYTFFFFFNEIMFKWSYNFNWNRVSVYVGV